MCYYNGIRGDTMPRSENQKIKILHIAQYLLENSDENHAVVAGDIVDYLNDECGIPCERRAIYRDIAALRDIFGMNIEGCQGGKYKLASRQFEYDDLLLLCECVHAAKFISAPKAKELISTISEFCSLYQADSLKNEVFLCDRVKTTQKGILNNISLIRSAMATKLEGKRHTPQKITFKYMTHSTKNVKVLVEKNSGRTYKVSPYKLLINEGNYYLLAFDDLSQEIRTYRVDKMTSIKLIDEKRSGEELFDKLDLTTYTQRVFSMFTGTKEFVSIQFNEDLLDTVIERFGTNGNVFFHSNGNGTFTVGVEVEVSEQFFGWICGFGNRAKIIKPDTVVVGLKEFLQKIESQY